MPLAQVRLKHDRERLCGNLQARVLEPRVEILRVQRPDGVAELLAMRGAKRRSIAAQVDDGKRQLLLRRWRGGRGGCRFREMSRAPLAAHAQHQRQGDAEETDL